MPAPAALGRRVRGHDPGREARRATAGWWEDRTRAGVAPNGRLSRGKPGRSPDDCEDLLRQPGRPREPPPRLRRAVLRVPKGSVLSRQVRAWRIQIAAAAAAVLLVATGAVAAPQLTSFHSLASVTLRRASGTHALPALRQTDRPN